MDKSYGILVDGLMRPLVSVSNKDGVFVMPMTKSNRERIGRDGTFYPAHTQEIGWLRFGTQDRDSLKFDSLSEWNGGNGFIEARIPWGLLNVSDPSSKSIVSTLAGLRQGPDGTPLTDGMRFLLAEYSGDPLFTWDNWEEPTWHAVRKKSFAIYQQALLKIQEAP